ncbi:hypothetical protein [Azospirillum picis]|uniref:Uncharacterized protein n=1 Tax=Azospirillum picis TaxID=488438 RepID=A0ABU0MRA3_9PROT|nr:hypothetical protein [Azospirillum picis]MBP2302428.1 hypothetical protein [Azospirillum picis]MDQ0536007.1 hypothetical protein [Azospirillum picis]
MIPISGGYTTYSAEECKRLEMLLQKLEQESLLVRAETSPYLRKMLDARIDDVARRLGLLAALSPNGRRGLADSNNGGLHTQRAH